MLEELIIGFGQGVLVMVCVYGLIIAPVGYTIMWLDRRGNRP
jgi:hypothetical protein